MGDRCPRLELTIPTESTSFKRSWDELGLDLSSSPNGDRSNGGEGSSSGERNKRARSESSARSVTVASSSGNLASGSSSRTASSPRRATLESHEGTASPVDLVLDEPDSVAEPMDGVEPLPSILDLSPRASPAAEQNAQFRLSMERFNAFDSNISVLRHSDSPMPGPSLPRAARTMLETALDSSSPVLEMPPTPNLNTIARSRPPTPPSPHTLMSRLSAAPPALPPVATVSGAPSWLTDFDDALRPIALDHGDDLPFQWGSRSAQSSVRSPPYSK
ncbi:hypothetical protein EVJ58_g2352 [Rhodofomes roseus]|uniref:Uncharacterized protein n=1 Tax=Rhodofomes roseus TaxID=34475 RepID=A0A4Y9YSU4_9APHY|nr:hypothetical protein EVJ58_g2352 [Rhodofomes roseus]